VSWTFRRLRTAPRVRIPLEQCAGFSALPCVEIGQIVQAGQKIALPENPFAVALHASVSGRVTALGNFPHPVKGEGPAIEITPEEHQAPVPAYGRERADAESLSREEILSLFREGGLVEAGAGMMPLHVKCFMPENTAIHTLILNACESEPYVTCAHSLMLSHPVEILKGAEILRRVMGAGRVLIVTQKDKQEPAEVLKSKIYYHKWDTAEVRVLPVQYPQDEEILLIREFCGIDLSEAFRMCRNAGSTEPREFMWTRFMKEAGVMVLEVSTAFAVYETVMLGKPLLEKGVTVGGECVIEPRNTWLPIGMLFQDAIKENRGLMRDPARVVMNGPMRGRAQPTLEVPVIKGTQAILALPGEVIPEVEPKPCIHCNRCVEACPAGISPVMITLAAERGLFQDAKQWGVEYCLSCGSCTYLCPSRRPMAEWIRLSLEHLGSGS